eukprot:489183-Rhodomonas_salina.4
MDSGCEFRVWCDGRQQDAHPPRRAMELQRSGQWHALRHSRRVSVRSWRRAPMMMIDIKLGNCRFGQRDEYISKAMADIQTFCYRNHVKAIQGYELHLPPARVLAFTLFLQCSSHHHLDFRVSGLAAVMAEQAQLDEQVEIAKGFASPCYSPASIDGPTSPVSAHRSLPRPLIHSNSSKRHGAEAGKDEIEVEDSATQGSNDDEHSSSAHQVWRATISRLACGRTDSLTRDITQP